MDAAQDDCWWAVGFDFCDFFFFFATSVSFFVKIYICLPLLFCGGSFDEQVK